jgi:hypothetical protein
MQAMGRARRSTCVATSPSTWQIGLRKKERAMPTPADVRKIALSLPGVSEIDHFARPAWRTKKRIFAVMRPDGLFLNLADERKEFLFEADPKVFVKYMWGKRANVIVQIDKISKRELKALMRESHALNSPPPGAPKKARAKRKTR